MPNPSSGTKKPRQKLLKVFSSTPSQHTPSPLGLAHIIDHTKPDISILCDMCKAFLNVSELATHTTYHNALQLYKFKDIPTSMETLIKRRELLIQRMQRMNISDESYLKYVKTINDTFQILKRSIEPYFYGDNAYIYENLEASQVQGFSFIPRNRLFLSIGMCSSQNKQFKNEMEDTMKFVDCFGGSERFAYIGLFDGYNGKNASSLCRDHLHDAVLFELSKFIPQMKSNEAEDTLINRLYSRMIDPTNISHEIIEDIGDAFRLSYSKMDYLLSRGLNETSAVRWSGTSALSAVIVADDHLEDFIIKTEDEEKEQDEIKITFGHIHVSNCGNVEALGIRAGEAFLMSQKHILTNQRERTRVLEAGISISENNLVAGILGTTRGLGNHGDKDLKKCVISNPYTWTYPIDPSLECIIIATEGLWDVLRYDLVVDLVTQCLPAHHLSGPSRLQTALRSVLEKYGPSHSTPLSNTGDEINACMSEILGLIEENDENDEGSNTFSHRNRGVQCSADEIQEAIWNALPSQQRLRLELAQTIAERLVSAALLAESKSNVSVICLILPGAAV